MSAPARLDDLSCTLRVTGASEDEIARLVASFIDGRAGVEASAVRVESAVLVAVAVATGAAGEPVTFEVSPKPGVLRLRYVHTIALVLERLWARELAAHATCVFAEELPRFGGEPSRA